MSKIVTVTVEQAPQPMQIEQYMDSYIRWLMERRAERQAMATRPLPKVG